MSDQLGKYLIFINLSEKNLKLKIHSNVRTLVESDHKEESSGNSQRKLNEKYTYSNKHRVKL